MQTFENYHRWFTRDPRKRNLLTILFIIIIYSLILFLLISNSNKILFAVDFSEYWAAGRLTLSGSNPYSTEAVLSIQEEIGWPYELPMMMYNPPWGLSLVLLFSNFYYNLGRISWLIISCIVILISTNMLWSIYGGSPRKRWIAWILSFTYVPVIIGLDVGQIAPFLLLGLSGFLYFQNSRKWILSGLFLYFITLKPQLLYVFWLVLLFWIIHDKRWLVLWASLVTLIIASIIPMLFNPTIYAQYIEFYLNNPPFQWEPPVISFALRVLFGMEKYWLQFIPSIIGFLVTIFYWYHHKDHWQWEDKIFFVIIISIITTSYGWSFDLIIVLPIMVFATIHFMKQPRIYAPLLIIYLIINGLMLFMLIVGTPAFYGLWVPFTWLSFYLVLRKLDIFGTN